ncbi:hypothetical protein BJV78DRAFT_387384 [Lactifluus subvellereus]|nr:hypothetical protein BJV78DRAFT_387384 [Lactifluus subvellereus]
MNGCLADVLNRVSTAHPPSPMPTHHEPFCMHSRVSRHHTRYLSLTGAPTALQRSPSQRTIVSTPQSGRHPHARRCLLFLLLFIYLRLHQRRPVLPTPPTHQQQCRRGGEHCSIWPPCRQTTRATRTSNDGSRAPVPAPELTPRNDHYNSPTPDFNHFAYFDNLQATTGVTGSHANLYVRASRCSCSNCYTRLSTWVHALGTEGPPRAQHQRGHRQQWQTAQQAQQALRRRMFNVYNQQQQGQDRRQ